MQDRGDTGCISRFICTVQGAGVRSPTHQPRTCPLTLWNVGEGSRVFSTEGRGGRLVPAQGELCVLPVASRFVRLRRCRGLWGVPEGLNVKREKQKLKKYIYIYKKCVCGFLQGRAFVGSCLQRRSPFCEAALMQQEETCCVCGSLYLKGFLLGFNQEAHTFHLHPFSVQRL